MEKMPTPCAACKHLRRKCIQACVFAPYFPANQQDKYTAVHKVFGASHVARILNEIHPNQRQDAMNSLAFEAQARLLDPVHGCTPLIYNLQRQLEDLEHQIQVAKNELASYNIVTTLEPPPPITYQQNHHNPLMMPVGNYGGHLTSQQLRQLPEDAHRYASAHTAQIQQKPETQTNHKSESDNKKDMISSKI
ncbi:hypothetical protein EUTSA_v10011114mg [Eutrema salsugineum]|uniref:LOB domain-containing protein n=1 Tax=Eutrema salsugineum TaxID=72664 RepID=V4LNZ6_EUTSA|nr:LOB domain-containing protein 28 [Eutrema salsugineum]ESQ45479.1 hypothetical protein EUTSA_v10011114mg [Eutrema salsugineum]